MKKLYLLSLSIGLWFLSQVVHADSFRTSGDLWELVQDADLVVEGKVEEAIASYPFYGYESYSSVLYALDRDTPLKLSLPATDYRIKVDKILKSRQGVRPDAVVLRMVPQKVEQIGTFNQTLRAHPERVEKQVFFLKRNPDGSYSPPTLDGIMHFRRDANTGVEQLVYTLGQETRVLPGAQGRARDILGEIARLSGETP